MPVAESSHTGPGVVSTGWLAADSTYGRKERGRLGAGLGASLALHGALLAILMLRARLDADDRSTSYPIALRICVPAGAGPGWGRWWQLPRQRRQRPLEIPKHEAARGHAGRADRAGGHATAASAAHGAGDHAECFGAAGEWRVVRFARAARRRGTGTWRRARSGQLALVRAKGGGTGGGVFRPGAGIVDPKVVKEVRPTYTPDAMRAKIQGEVLLEAVVLDRTARSAT